LAENIFIKPFKEAAAKSSVEIHVKRSFNKTPQQNPSTKPFNKTPQQNTSKDLG
tara:strand:- start:158 stop:319 length:162 start_codon:yes stop_codon:yes gene_type:complete